MARLTRLSLPGLPHHLMQIGHNRQAIFVDDEDRRAWCAHLREASLVARVDVHAYVLMDNHVHLLATPRENAEGVSTMMQSLGRRYVAAFNRRHGRILQQIGAHHVVLPEHDMGERVAHLLSGRMLDYVEIEENFALGKTRAPMEIVGRRLGDRDALQRDDKFSTCLDKRAKLKSRGVFGHVYAAPAGSDPMHDQAIPPIWRSYSDRQVRPS